MDLLISVYRSRKFPFCPRCSSKTAVNSFRIIDFPLSTNSSNKDCTIFFNGQIFQLVQFFFNDLHSITIFFIIIYIYVQNSNALFLVLHFYSVHYLAT